MQELPGADDEHGSVALIPCKNQRYAEGIASLKRLWLFIYSGCLAIQG
jgi:hypothetical protein